VSGRPEVVFFDAGGTLLEPRVPVGHVYAQLASHYGLRADGDALQAGFVQAWKELKPRDPVQGARVLDDRQWWKEVVRLSWRGTGLPQHFPFDAYFDEVYGAFAHAHLWRVYPDVWGALEKLRCARVRCAVFSNWDRRLHAILKALELDGYFEQVLVSSVLGAEKPHPIAFQRAQECCGIAASQAFLIGDEAVFDRQGAEAAGWRWALVERPRTDLNDLLARHDLI
jgi:putative hydrolase of the HAD superfamily